MPHKQDCVKYENTSGIFKNSTEKIENHIKKEKTEPKLATVRNCRIVFLS